MSPELLAGLERALELGGCTHTLDDVWSQVESGDAQLWHDEGAVIITEVHDTPRMRVIHFWLASGELERVVQLSERALKWAGTQGCRQATLAGRRGWERVLAAAGWSPSLVLLSREITHGKR
jgi:hypothetical protein